MKKKQEEAGDWFERAKELARIEREQKVERWMHVTIVKTNEATWQRERIFHYDLPVAIYERYRWVIRWRVARFQCKHPRFKIDTTISTYYKTQGVNIGMKEDMDKFIAAKATHTRHKRILQEYIEAHESDIFFNEETDEQVAKSRARIARDEQTLQECEQRLRNKVEEFKNDKTKTKQCCQQDLNPFF